MLQENWRERRFAMNHQPSRSPLQAVCHAVAGLCLFLLLSGQAAAQRPAKPPGGPDLKGDMQQRGVRESVLRSNGSSTATPKVDAKKLEAAIEKVKEDFRQIQIIRNTMVRNLLAEKPLDYPLIAGQSAEIQKRAEHLKNFFMPEAGEDKEKKKIAELQPEEMKEALVQLCNRIASFVDNPILKSPDVKDVEQSAKAGGDLLSIIELSGNLKRSAEKRNRLSR
jgi:hypothetical protein